MQVIPAIDVLDGSAVRLMRGDYGAVTTYADNPAAVGTAFVDQGATLVHVVDLEAARGGARSLHVVQELRGASLPFQLGGGIRTAKDAKDAVAGGARRVVVGTTLLTRDGAAGEIVDAVGAERVVAAIDVRDGRARGSGWLGDGVPVAAAIESVLGLGVPRVLVTGIETDGTMEGPAFGLFAEVRRLAPDLRIIVSGGVGSLQDVQDLSTSDVGIEAVIVGRALYEKRFTLPEAIKVADRAVQ